jgi:hypothetical protein
MLSRIAGRLITGPVAFFLAGALDVGAMLVLFARWRLAKGPAAARGTAGRAGSATRPS